MDSDSPLKDERRLHILDAATELLATKPTASLAEIATHARIGKATLHRYFPTREALLIELAYRALNLVSEVIQTCRLDQDPAPVALARLAEALVPHGDKWYFLLNEHFWDVNPDLAQAEETVQAPILALIERGQAEGTLRRDISATWIIYLLDFTMFAAWQAIFDGSIARRDAPRLMIEGLLGGIAVKR
ncbi:MAG: TetR/AcrR family transcriptional regulator [Anaerolineae bacterium]|nr:TetR/AcrR family transcriptional regulator [Anaerolineae bacterium]